jgi:glycosyltransferase involved in cell wall biosynthesis
MIPPLVTIITPSYNQGRFIEETINSVLSQDYSNIEYIVVDGGSSDNTIDILRKYDGKLTWISEKDNGQSDAINKGFKMATGEIVAWLNSDDTYEPGAVSAAVNYFINNPDCVLVYGEGDITDEFSNKVKRFEATQDFDLWMLVNVWDYIMQPTTFFKRESLEKVDYLDVNLYWCMDWDLWIKLASIGEVGYLNQVLANSREYAETKTSTGGWKRLSEIGQLMRKYSNKKYPYGYFLYLASTFYTEYTSVPILGFISRKFLQYFQQILFRVLPIKYRDNWVGKKYSLLIPSTIKTLKINIKPIYPTIQIKEIMINGQPSKFILEHETLQLNLGNISRSMFNEITLYATRTVKPNNINKEIMDFRDVSFNVNEIK